MLGLETSGEGPNLIHRNGRRKNVRGIGIDGYNKAHLPAAGYILRLTVAGKENNDPVVIPYLLGQVIAQNLENIFLCCILIEQDSGLKTKGFELFSHHPGILDSILE